MPARKYNLEELNKMRDDGFTMKQIAEAINANPVYIRRILAWTLCKKICANCGKEFECIKGSAMYCTDACKHYAHRLRIREKVNTR